MEYEWPGNVRELENIIEQMVVVTQGEVITLRTSPLSLRRSLDTQEIVPVEDRPLRHMLEEVERRALELAYRSTDNPCSGSRSGSKSSTVVRR